MRMRMTTAAETRQPDPWRARKRAPDGRYGPTASAPARFRRERSKAPKPHGSPELGNSGRPRRQAAASGPGETATPHPAPP